MKRVLIIVACLLFIPVIFIVMLWFNYNIRHPRNERVIDQKFHTEIARIPEITVDNFMLWEGDSMATITIQDKGKVSMWYGIDGIPRIGGINGINTETQCFFVNENAKKTRYAYDMSLVITKDSDFSPWFSFKVLNLSDLVNHYDDIVAIVETFPKDVHLENLTDSSGTRMVRAVPDNNYAIQKKYWGKPVVCDLLYNGKYAGEE